MSSEGGSESESGVARSWPDLPPEALCLIGKFLATPLDVSCFISVCKKWRSSLSIPTTTKPSPNPGILSPFLPLQIPNSANLPFTNRPDDTLILIASAVLLVQPIDSGVNSNRWLLTVEERKPGKLRLLNSLSRSSFSVDLPSNFPNCLCLFKFRVTDIAKNYSFKYASDGEDVCNVEWARQARKVVLCSTSSITDCTAMVLYGDGRLVGIRVRNGEWGYVRQSLISPFSNVGRYESMAFAVDNEGRAYAVDHMLMKVSSTLCRENLDFREEKNSWGHRRKNLSSLNHHVTEFGGELYLIVWDYRCVESSPAEAFEVYKLNKGQRKWVSVETFGNGVLFVSQSWCFLMDIENRIRSNGKVIVCCYGCFYNYNAVKSSWSLFGGYSVNFGFHLLLKEMCDRDTIGAISTFKRDIADMMWLPPTWFWSDTFSSIRNELDKDGQADELPSGSEYQDSKSEFSKVMSQADISCNIVPILQKVWAKHGNIFEGSNVRSKLMISCALESLAEVIITLEGNSATTLTEAQCNDLTSTLCDLRQLNLRVEWLAPFVEKALALHISKPMIAAVAELNKAIARANVVKTKFPNSLANADHVLKALEKDRNSVLKGMPISEPMDLDECLGEGLF